MDGVTKANRFFFNNAYSIMGGVGIEYISGDSCEMVILTVLSMSPMGVGGEAEDVGDVEMDRHAYQESVSDVVEGVTPNCVDW